MSESFPSWMHPLSWVMVVLGVASSALVGLDIARRVPQAIKVMSYVWPINTLWAGLIGVLV